MSFKLVERPLRVLANERISSSTGIKLDDWVDSVGAGAVEAVWVHPEMKALELGWVA
jgi:hypothetical protein